MTATRLLLRKGLLSLGRYPQDLSEAVSFLTKAYTNVYVTSAVALTLIRVTAWILAVAKGKLSRSYPFMAPSYALVALFSWLPSKEDGGAVRWPGTVVIFAGVFLVARS